jgi:6-pyruvoyltetrahydropterin/6-carboxytetrahydropterin synthase
MSAAYVTRREHFSAAHRLHNPAWDEGKNERVFDKCNNAAGHGHNYILDVTVAGQIDPDTGYVIDVKLLSRIIHERVLDKVDHKHLNVDVDFMRGLNPTVENIAVGIWNELQPHIPAGKLYRIVLHETEKNSVEYMGE